MSWVSGRFDRSNMPLGLRPLSPGEAVEAIGHIDLKELSERGKKLVLLDVDNTLLPWRANDIPQSTLEWLQQGKDHGIQFCILSNTRKPKRLKGLAEKLDIPFLRGRFKPSRSMYIRALDKYGASADEAVMIGDQLFTDVLGANRAGIDSIWVRKMHSHEFLGTRWVSRNMERLVQRLLCRFVDTVHSHTDAGIEAELPLVRPSGFATQFVRFAIVGASSFLIDYMISLTLYFAISWDGVRLSEWAGAFLVEYMPILFVWAREPVEAFWPIAAACGASVAILNSFYWNRRWTFGIMGPEERGSQFKRFVAVSLIGLGLNVLISTVLFTILPFSEKNNGRVAKVAATMLVAIWNFAGQKFFAFRTIEDR